MSKLVTYLFGSDEQADAAHRAWSESVHCQPFAERVISFRVDVGTKKLGSSAGMQEIGRRIGWAMYRTMRDGNRLVAPEEAPRDRFWDALPTLRAAAAVDRILSELHVDQPGAMLTKAVCEHTQALRDAIASLPEDIGFHIRLRLADSGEIHESESIQGRAGEVRQE